MGAFFCHRKTGHHPCRRIRYLDSWRHRRARGRPAERLLGQRPCLFRYRIASQGQPRARACDRRLMGVYCGYARGGENMSRKLRVGVVGATGMVGQRFVAVSQHPGLNW